MSEAIGPRTNDFEIGQRLKEARDRAGLSQAQVAKLTGFDQPKIQLIEAGGRSVKARELYIFAELYSVGYDWILGEWGESDLPDELVAMAEKLPPVDRRKLLKTLASFGQMF